MRLIRAFIESWAKRAKMTRAKHPMMTEEVFRLGRSLAASAMGRGA